MLIDDRLATVLRSGVTSEAAGLTQFRQLIDLTGALTPARKNWPTDEDDRPVEDSEALDAAYDRLGQLIAQLPAARLAAILREPGLRLRNARLAGRLARSEPHIASAAMASAQLTESEWLHLIPRLPVTARGVLRHRRDLPFSAMQVLQRLGVRDLVLSGPDERPAPRVELPAFRPIAAMTENGEMIVPEIADEVEAEIGAEVRQEPEPAPAPLPAPPPAADIGIGALVRRIETFRQSRDRGEAREPMPDIPAPDIPAIAFVTDSEGAITWADPEIAPLAIGLVLAGPRGEAVATLDRPGWSAMRDHLPLRAARLAIDGARPIAGEWLVDARPLFAAATGAFQGYRGRMRRPAAAPAPAPAETADQREGDRIRQVLHELRTPVNAIQGFAEVIQQQVFGPAPNEYRALAAAIAVDAARLMAAFDEMDRLARLQSRAMAIDPGATDMRAAIHDTLQRLEGALRPRGAGMALEVSGGPFDVPFADGDMRQLAWRLLATIAGALGPGEEIALTLAGDGARMILRAELPAALKDGDIFAATAPAQARAVSAGMFGSGFALRLARAEARAAGGALHHADAFVELVLPVLTGAEAGHSVGAPGGGDASTG